MAGIEKQGLVFHLAAWITAACAGALWMDALHDRRGVWMFPVFVTIMSVYFFVVSVRKK